MPLRLKVVAIMILTATLVFVENHDIAAQDDPPDFRMLMNLDLFASRASDVKDAPETKGAPSSATDDSMLDQIRALNAMGYLGADHDSARYAGPQNSTQQQAPPSPPVEGNEGEQQ
jgi:hypothetical protein